MLCRERAAQGDGLFLDRAIDGGMGFGVLGAGPGCEMQIAVAKMGDIEHLDAWVECPDAALNAVQIAELLGRRVLKKG